MKNYQIESMVVTSKPIPTPITTPPIAEYPDIELPDNAEHVTLLEMMVAPQQSKIAGVVSLQPTYMMCRVTYLVPAVEK